ncbi:MAG TPA: hypothetical protein VFV70_07370 [Hyphomonadaceae bacterium]|nr:hypothetical protein [Hyphomonadaceae bacterium]
MKLRSCVCAAALAAAAVSFTAPAMGQISNLRQLTEAQNKEIFCLNEELQRDDDVFYLVMDAYFTGSDDEEAEAVAKKAIDACASRYNWDTGKRDLAAQAGFFTAAIDYLLEDLPSVAKGDVEAVDRVARKLTEDDAERFLRQDWLDDAAFLKRIETLLTAEKFSSNDSYDLETAYFILEAYVVQTTAAWQFVETYINKKS